MHVYDNPLNNNKITDNNIKIQAHYTVIDKFRGHLNMKIICASPLSIDFFHQVSLKSIH